MNAAYGVLLLLLICGTTKMWGRGDRGGGGRRSGGSWGRRGGSRISSNRVSSGGRLGRLPSSRSTVTTGSSGTSGDFFGGMSLYRLRTPGPNVRPSSHFRDYLAGATAVHLLSRPLTTFYYQNRSTYYRNYHNHIEPSDGDKVCGAYVGPDEIVGYIRERSWTSWQVETSMLVYFVCDRSCCDLDCCELNLGFVFLIIIVCLLSFIFGICIYAYCKREREW